MKKTFQFLFMLSYAFPGYAAEGAVPESSGSSLAVILFLGFIALIIVGQLIPGVMLFISMVRGLFKKQPNEIKHADHK
ncbi:hypothetical protein [Trichloromonas sp.]|uniref:hypothetical protein n=1 Tax=Trichloromonas sp. TaxID=3069249 RepID=UPI003D814952